MKIIDLLNKIAKGEEVPKIIKYDLQTYYFRNYDYKEYDIEKKYIDEQTSFIEDKFDFFKINDEVEIIEDKTPQETIKQISKMIASGKIPKDIYDEYLSNCPIGFMNENELVDFLLEREAIDENSLEDMIDESLFKDKDIEKIKVNMLSTECYINQIEDKINELIDEVNRLKNKEK